MATNQPIIIKKVRKAHHDEHHGGAWKVAYADFVTAIIALDEHRIASASYDGTVRVWALA
jgi:WD40 repeat protein